MLLHTKVETKLNILISLNKGRHITIRTYILSEPLTFNEISSPSQCQGCQRSLIFRFFYPTENVRSIAWLKGNKLIPIASAFPLDEVSELTLFPGEGYENRVLWDREDVASITLIDLRTNDSDVYTCFVLFSSRDYITNITYLDTSRQSCKHLNCMLNLMWHIIEWSYLW